MGHPRTLGKERIRGEVKYPGGKNLARSFASILLGWKVPSVATWERERHVYRHNKGLAEASDACSP